MLFNKAQKYLLMQSNFQKLTRDTSIIFNKGILPNICMILKVIFTPAAAEGYSQTAHFLPCFFFFKRFWKEVYKTNREIQDKKANKVFTVYRLEVLS